MEHEPASAKRPLGPFAQISDAAGCRAHHCFFLAAQHLQSHDAMTAFPVLSRPVSFLALAVTVGVGAASAAEEERWGIALGAKAEEDRWRQGRKRRPARHEAEEEPDLSLPTVRNVLYARKLIYESNIRMYVYIVYMS